MASDAGNLLQKLIQASPVASTWTWILEYDKFRLVFLVSASDVSNEGDKHGTLPSGCSGCVPVRLDAGSGGRKATVSLSLPWTIQIKHVLIHSGR